MIILCMKSYPAQNTLSHPDVRAGPLTVNPNIIRVFRQFGEGWAYADYTKVLPLLTESFAASFNPCKLACVAERGETSKESNTLPLFRFQVRSTSL